MRRKRPGPNSPCACGSGKKTKKCCGVATPGAGPRPPGLRERLHELDRRLVHEAMTAFLEEVGEDLADSLAESYGLGDPEVEGSLFTQWLLFGRHGDEARCFAAVYREDAGFPPTGEEAAWVDAGCAAWPSIWEVTGVVPGRTLELRDRLTGATRVVSERSASQGLRPGLLILARVVDLEGISLLIGLDHRPLMPFEGLEVLEAFREELELEEDEALEPEELQEAETWALLQDIWRGRVLARQSSVPRIQNEDGDLLEFVEDRFEFAAEHREDVLQALGQHPKAYIQPPEPPEQVVTFFRDPGGEDPVSSIRLGTATLRGTSLLLECDSRRRADELRAWVEASLGQWVRHQGREAQDQQSLREELERRRTRAGEQGTLFPERAASPPPEAVPPEIADPIIREAKANHYANWPDLPLPALQGKTPREALVDPRGRARVEALLREMELGEQASPPGQRFDVGLLRRELGLPG